jgi:hypothetical protein
MNRTRWLDCIASPGQFRDEFAVHGKDFNGREFSLFVSRNFVKCQQEPAADDEVPARLQILLLDQRDELCLIRLPGNTFDNGSTITVYEYQLEKDQLESCATAEYA